MYWLGDVNVTRGRGPRIAMEGIATAGNGSDEPRGPRRVADGGAHLGYQVVQARVGHEGRRPETLEELGLGHHIRPPIE